MKQALGVAASNQKAGAEEAIHLHQELEKLSGEELMRIARLWQLKYKSEEKRSLLKAVMAAMQDSFYMKGVLEKLSSTQMHIYSFLLKSKEAFMTLSEISRKIGLPPTNTEMELSVLKRYFLVQQRKNRERLTNNLDRYYCYAESGRLVNLDELKYSKGLKIHFKAKLIGRPLPMEWRKVLGSHASSNGVFDEDSSHSAGLEENLAKIFRFLKDIEQELVRECFQQGGIMEMSMAREFLRSYKQDWVPVAKKLHELGILIDEYYMERKFIRILLMPEEVFNYLQQHPLISKAARSTRQRQSGSYSNDYDFCINIKRLILYISRRGINLAKSGKIKQVDLRETQDSFLQTDMSLFIEKSQLYQVELLLPVLRLFNIVRIKYHDVVLRNDHEQVLDMPYPQLLEKTLKLILSVLQKRSHHYEELFSAADVPFPEKALWEECVAYIKHHKKFIYHVLIASLLRKHLVLAPAFAIEHFSTDLQNLRRKLSSVLFYLQLLGLIEVDYPQRWIAFSRLGRQFFLDEKLAAADAKGAVILNPDMTLVAIPEKLSLESLRLLKSFCHLQSYDNIYTFQVTKASFQQAILLKEKAEDFLKMLEKTVRHKLSQNFLFSVKEWSSSLPLLRIVDECVVVQTKNPEHMVALLGQIANKRIVQEKIGDNTILIHPAKIPELISYAEKLDLLVKLVR